VVSGGTVDDIWEGFGRGYGAGFQRVCCIRGAGLGMWWVGKWDESNCTDRFGGSYALFCADNVSICVLPFGCRFGIDRGIDNLEQY
jgi:hypothetical protein